MPKRTVSGVFTTSGNPKKGMNASRSPKKAINPTLDIWVSIESKDERIKGTSYMRPNTTTNSPFSGTLPASKSVLSSAMVPR